MTTTPATVDQSRSPAPRTSPKRWFLLATLSGFSLFAFWLVFRDRSLAVIALPDGQRFVIHKLTFGKDHEYWGKSVGLTSAEIWANQWLARIGRQISPTFSSGGQHLTTTPTVALWHSFDWTKKDSLSTPYWVVLSDQHGWRTSIDTRYLRTAAPPAPRSPGQPTVPQAISFQIPSASSKLQLEFLNSDGDRLAMTQIPGESPKELAQVWTVQPFPVTEKNDSMNVTLTGLSADWSDPADTTPKFADALTITPQFVTTIDGFTSTSWVPLTEGVPFFETFFGQSPTVATIESPMGASAGLTRCTVSPYESAWKLHLALVCRNPEEFAASERFHLAGVSFESGLPAVPEASAAVTVGGSILQFLGAGRAGSFEYEGAGESNHELPILPLQDLTANRLQGTLLCTDTRRSMGHGTLSYTSFGMNTRPLQYPMTVQLKFTAPRPHIVLSLTNSGERYPVVLVHDESGQIVDGELFNAQGLLVWLARRPCDDLEKINVTVLMQKPRQFTFIVPPPKVPTRPSRELKSIDDARPMESLSAGKP